MGLLNTAEAPDPLTDPEDPMLPEDPDDLLPDPDNLERWMEAGVPLDVIQHRMQHPFDNFGVPPSRMLAPKAMNHPPTNLTPRHGVPHLNEFLTVAGPRNPHKTTRDLVQYWNEHYGHVDPNTLPSLETFLPAAKEDNPKHSDQALTAYWQDHYGSLGAPEKDYVAPSPGVLATAKDLGRKVAAGAVTDVPKMTGQATAARTRP